MHLFLIYNMILSKGLNWVKHIFFVIGIMPALMMFYFREYVIGLLSSCQWKPLLSLCNIICDIKISGHDYFLWPGGDINHINNPLICPTDLSLIRSPPVQGWECFGSYFSNGEAVSTSWSGRTSPSTSYSTTPSPSHTDFSLTSPAG